MIFSWQGFLLVRIRGREKSNLGILRSQNGVEDFNNSLFLLYSVRLDSLPRFRGESSQRMGSISAKGSQDSTSQGGAAPSRIAARVPSMLREYIGMRCLGDDDRIILVSTSEGG